MPIKNIGLVAYAKDKLWKDDISLSGDYPVIKDIVSDKILNLS